MTTTLERLGESRRFPVHAHVNNSPTALCGARINRDVRTHTPEGLLEIGIRLPSHLVRCTDCVVKARRLRAEQRVDMLRHHGLLDYSDTATGR